MTLGAVELTVIGLLVKKELREAMGDLQGSSNLGGTLLFAVPAAYALFPQRCSRVPSTCAARSPRSLLPGVAALPVWVCVDLHDPRKV